MAKLFADSGQIAICSFVSPFSEDRELARKIHKDSDLRFYEVYVNTPLSVCESRDVKGLYKKAREGSIQGFTGVTQAYEAPEKPDLIVTTESVSIESSCNQVIDLLESEEIIPKQIRDTEVVSVSCYTNSYVECCFTSVTKNFKFEQIPELFVPASRKSAALNESKSLPHLKIKDVELQWLQVLAEGWAYPLKGFMRENEYLQVN